MQKKVEELKKGEKVKLADQIGVVEEIELSDIGKQGKAKCRLVISFKNEKITIIRPEGYPIEVL